MRAALQRLGGTVLFGGPIVPHLWSHWIFQDDVVLETIEPERLPPLDANTLCESLVAEEDRLPLAIDRGDVVEVILAAIAQIVQDPRFDQKWLDAAGTDDIRRILKSRLREQTSGPSVPKETAQA